MRQLLLIATIAGVLVALALVPIRKTAASDASPSAPATVSEADISASTSQQSLKILIPVRWQSGILERAAARIRLIDLNENIISEQAGHIYHLRENHTYAANLLMPSSLENPSLYCIDYSLTFSNGSRIEGRKSLAGALGSLETRLIGSRELLAGAKGGLRLVALDHYSEKPIPGASVSFVLKSASAEKTLFSGQTGKEGTVDATFLVPPDSIGKHTLIVRVESALGSDTIETPIEILKEYKILLTTDKPLYQPGQTIHIRTLSLEAGSSKPAAKEDAVIEVFDPKNNKVFKLKKSTDPFGIAAADFILADEVNLGTYKVRVAIGQTASEKDITVSRYVLPKFKVVTKPDKDYYSPGEVVRAEVQADYFFGKPVSSALVIAKLSSFDVELSEFARIEGKTNQSGHYSFEVKLPEHFVGQPLVQGKALVKLDLKVVDGSDHAETAILTLPVVSDALEVVAVPESGALVPGMENIIYLITTYPDGTPAETTLDVVLDSGRRLGGLKADTLGIVSINLTPGDTENSILVTAQDRKGNRLSKKLVLPLETGQNHLLLRTDKSLYKVGDNMSASIFATRLRGNVYLDIIKDGQTMLTKVVELQNGKAKFDVLISADLSGTLQVNAYQILPSSDIIRDSRLLYVESATDLLIEASLNRDVYQPGDTATIDFSVRNSAGHPVLAALGISIVDESVFALQEMQPGLEKIFFTLEKEMMKPRYEVHGFSMEELILQMPDRIPPEAVARRRQAANVLMAAVEQLQMPALNLNSFDTKEQKFTTQVQQIMEKKAQEIETALQRYYKRHERFPNDAEVVAELLDERLLTHSSALDPWGNMFRVSSVSFYYANQLSFQLISSGPDEREGTTDDVSVWRQPPPRERRFFGAMLDRVEEGMMAPMSKMSAAGARDQEIEKDEAASNEANQVGRPAVRIRQYFPETLFFHPAIITDKSGKARLELPLADSITTWRMAAMASSMGGQLGSATFPIRVFQDFFIDIDAPVSLTQNDRVSLPVAVYNYLPETQNVRIEIAPEPWFELADEPVKELNIQSNEVSVVLFTIVAKKVGWHSLTVHGFGSKMNDAIKRQIHIVPDGEEHEVTINDRLGGSIRKTVVIPHDAIENASALLVKLYPGMFSQVVEGLDSILRMPSGCFEQTSSTTYPNILVLDYLKKTKQLSPEIQMKAEGFINTGYQRLLTFEVNGGGFEWFGNPPANQVLTAYGLMEFHDMAQVHEVDPAIIERTQKWLLSKQQEDGSWKPDDAFLHQESWSRIQDSRVPVTAYILWALLESKYQGPEVEKSVKYIENGLDQIKDPYSLALVANALVLADPKHDRALDALAKLGVEDQNAVYWKTGQTMMYSHGISADVETTALAAIAFMRSERYPEISKKALTYLIRSKDSSGTWHSTQATVFAMKAMVTALGSMTEQADGEIAIGINGKNAATVKVTPENSDVMRMIDLTPQIRDGENEVTIDFVGKGNLLYQIVGRYYLPWTLQENPREAISFKIDYDKTKMEKDDLATCNVSLRNNAPVAANMLVIDLGIPPGFSVQGEDFEKLVEKGAIEKFSLTARQAILYIRRLKAGQNLELSYQLKAKYPIRAKTPSSRVYEYYDPSKETTTAPIILEIQE